MNKKILVLSNDKIFIDNDKISTDNNDTINIIEGLAKKNHLSFFCKSAKKIRNFVTIKNKYRKFKKKNFFNFKDNFNNYKILMISITPFNLFALIFIKIFNRKIKGYVYLRSDGHKEYFYKYGLMGQFFYDLMFKIVTNLLKIIAVSRHLSGLKKNYTLIKPSEIENKWFLKRKKAELYKPKLLYIGRYKKEKGVFSLINIFDSINFNFELNIVGLKKKITLPNDKVKLFNEVNSTKKIISFYDKCNIFVLPSYTEGAPKVIFESLARHRPIIVFEEIKHVKENFRGIFVCKRQTKDFTDKVRYIIKNYKYIIKEIKKNKIHTRKQFQNELSEIFQ
jgi:glycosyltransferase involved in cell wall biosynthesis